MKDALFYNRYLVETFNDPLGARVIYPVNPTVTLTSPSSISRLQGALQVH